VSTDTLRKADWPTALTVSGDKRVRLRWAAHRFGHTIGELSAMGAARLEWPRFCPARL